MTIDELIGQVGARYLKMRLDEADHSDNTDDTARYLIDRLSQEQIVFIVKAILENVMLAKKVDIKLPRHLMQDYVQDYKLPNSLLVEERATYYRNYQCKKAALLLVTTGDDEVQSLNHLTRIGVAQLTGIPELWVDVASINTELSENHLKWWERALKGLFELNICSLEQVSQYILRTRNAIIDDGYPILQALDKALPALHIPKGTGDFSGIKENRLGHYSQWRGRYDAAYRRYACYLRKYTPNQTLLNEDDLQNAFNKAKDSIPERYHSLIAAFIEAPSGWNKQAQALAECEWDVVNQPLFEGLKPETKGIGELTFEFYKERDPEILTESDWDYLRQLKNRGKLPKNIDEEDKQFYEDHRNELKDDYKLRLLWDKFIFKTAIESDDFLIGLIQCLERLLTGKQGDLETQVTVRCNRRSNIDYQNLNVDAGLYFATRYRGLSKVFEGKVNWTQEIEKLFTFPQLVERWKKESRNLCHSTAKSARQIKFTIKLEPDGPERQLIWEFDLNSITTQFHDDFKRLAEHPLVFCSTTRESSNTKGEFQPLDISNIKSFVAAYGRNRGSFVSVYDKKNDIAIKWIENLEKAKQEQLLSDSKVDQIQAKFEVFQNSYTDAIVGFLEEGLACDKLQKQLCDFAELLTAICRHAKGDRNRELLLIPLMRIGTVEVKGETTISVVAPWHPLRLASMKVKAEQISKIFQRLLADENLIFGNTESFFFREIEEALAHPYYPEVVLGWDGIEPKLLSLTDTVGDYSLHEHPIMTNKADNETNDNPKETATIVTDLVQRYLQLQPHIQANLSVLLYNCDSVRLPQSVLEKVYEQNEKNENMLCQIILMHRNKINLRRLYEQIIKDSDKEVDTFNHSEVTEDFIARLRINIIADQPSKTNELSEYPFDIVFSQDVIARNSAVEWFPEDPQPVDILNLFPSQLTRRRSAAKDDMKSVVYLCCPIQSSEGWAYLTAIATVLKVKDNWIENDAIRLLPARRLDFQKQEMKTIFEETHSLGNWIINYDELLDRRQVENQGAKVIQYKQTSTQGRNIVISSKAELHFLKNVLVDRLKALDLDLGKDEYQNLAEKLCVDANRMSGDILLRAAKRGRNASELIGVVLSHFLIRHELKDNHHIGWYFLDDYASWLGLREGRIADIFALSPYHRQDDKFRLDIVIAEAKYININSLSSKKKESQKQLEDTFRRIDDTLFGQPEKLDKPILLTRLSDLILDGIQIPESENINLSDCRRSIREGKCEISLRGYSHVFISDSPEASECSELISLPNYDGAYQEVFSRSKVRELILSYMRDTDPITIRRNEVEKDIWLTKTYRDTLSSNSIVEKIPYSIRTNNVQPHVENTMSDQLNTETQSDIITNNTNGALNSEKDNDSQDDDTQQSLGTEHWSYKDIANFLLEYQENVAESEDIEKWLDEIGRKCKGALQQFQLQAKLIDSILTPNAALLKFQGSADLTVEQVLKRRSEFLTTYGLELISVRPEPQKVAISIARPERRILNLPQVWKKWEKETLGYDDPNYNKGNQEILIGLKEEDSSPFFLSPRENDPHTLIAGSTGSGKSVLMQNIILGIAATNRPDKARIVLIDPKMGVDYFAFENLPHLQGGIIDDQETAIEHLNQLLEEMDRRYQVLRENKVNDIFSLNSKPTATEHLPVLWIVHDEFAEWMMTEEYKNTVTNVVSRLGVKARAAGIFLVFAAQRPDSLVMPMQLRANLGNRLILRVDSDGTSDIALGEPGAENLLGKGHLAAKLGGESSIITAQVPFISSKELEEIVKIIQLEEITGTDS